MDINLLTVLRVSSSGFPTSLSDLLGSVFTYFTFWGDWRGRKSLSSALVCSLCGIGVFWHAAPPTRLCLKFPRETGLILMCARKVGNAFQTNQGIEPPVAIKRGEESQMKWCREPRCSPQVRMVCRETFGVASRVPSNFSLFNKERGTSLETL